MYSSEFEKDACGIGLIYSGPSANETDTISKALTMLANLSHRSALGADGKTSDGAGVLLELDLNFFRNCSETKDKIHRACFGVGMLFLSKENSVYTNEQKIKVAKHAENLGMHVVAWRVVPVDSSVLGSQAKDIEPIIYQIFIECAESEIKDFEKRLYILKSDLQRTTLFDIISLSSKTIVYKGLSLPSDLGKYFLDLQENKMKSRFAMVHSRFSTNTLPAWRLAQPFSTICHNGEINTLRGNLSWLKAREQEFTLSLSEHHSDRLRPLVLKGQSDSQYLDDMVNILRHSDISLPQTLMTLMPEAAVQDSEVRSFYDYQAPRMESWDGPAAVCFCDGEWIGAKLDRNGLRPCRYLILEDGTLILGSEIGILDVPLTKIKSQGRLGPGQIIAVNIITNEIKLDADLKSSVANERNYHKAVNDETLSFAPDLEIKSQKV